MNNNRFSANAQYPGQQVGESLDFVKNQYITAQKVYGQTQNLSSGSNVNIDINLPKDGRLLLGISFYLNYDNATENPTATLTVNNTKFIVQTGVRAMDIENLRERMYKDLNLSLSGNDTISMDINAVGNAKAIQMQFYYI